ncbi:proton pump interactor [Musa troglodytarum]|uniref:Proton pump interactor n=1 Tax=Musa troglodytarum TaxID=320322 RepID=A0A9E7GJ67_9LILI|nr:proton pump interactor [Musa troglodytarum]
MTADASEFNGGSGVELEAGTVGLGLGLECDRKESGDADGIVWRVGEEKDGIRIGRAVMVENGNLNDSRGKDLDLDGKVKSVTVRDPETGEGKREDWELSVENGGNHEESVEIKLAVSGVDVCRKTTASSDVAEIKIESESEGTEEGHSKEEADNDEQKEENEYEMPSGKESDAKGGAWEVKGEMSREEVNVEVSFENNHDYMEDNCSLEPSENTNEVETDSVTKVGEKQEGETSLEETNVEEELESVVEAKKKSETVVAVDDQVSSDPTVDDKKQEPNIIGIEANEQTVSESFVIEGSELEVKIVASDIYHEQQKAFDGKEEKLEIIADTTGADDQADKAAPFAVETKELQSVPMTPNNRYQAELVVLESQVTGTEDQEELEIVTKVELEKDPQIVSTDFQNQSELMPDAQVDKDQKPENFITDAMPSESSIEHMEMKLSNVTNNICLDENGTVLDVDIRSSLLAVDGSASSESQKAMSIADIDVRVSKDEAGGEFTGTGEIIAIELSDDLPSTEGSSSSGVPHVVDREVLVEVATSREVLLDANAQSDSCEKASQLELEGGNFSAVDVPGPSDSISSMHLESRLVNEGESISSFANIHTDIQDKLYNDAAENESVVAETGFDVAADHVDTVESKSRVENGSVESKTSLASSIEDKPSADVDDKEAGHGDSGVTEEIQVSTEDPGVSTLDAQKMDTPIGNPQACYIIRIPRFVDDQLSTNIQIAQSEMNEKTQKRDSIKVAIENQKFEDAKAEERAARAAVSAKCQQIDSVQLMMNKLKNAHSINELHDKIQTMEFELQHETMPLKEEKQYIHELKQLRHQRDQLTSNLGSKAEIDEAFNQREQIDERFKILKKELDTLRTELLQTERNANTVRKKYDEEQLLLKGLQQQFRDADAVRQKAYGHWRELKNMLNEKNKHFSMYKNDQKSAENYLSSRDFEGLLLHCSKQVEKVMELWNNDEEFRLQYVKSNMNSTLRRLNTSDGRSLGPDEDPPVIHSNQGKGLGLHHPQANIGVSVKPVALEAKLETSKEDSFPTLSAVMKNQPVKPKKPAKPMLDETKETPTARVLDREVENSEKVISVTKEEEEWTKKLQESSKEEELRKEKAAAELKEQCRLEQRAKAREAEERKRRQAKKAQARAEYRAQKEAELREKPKDFSHLQKKAKKQQKKGMTAEDTTGGAEDGPAPSTETIMPEAARETDVAVRTAPKRPSRLAITTKQYKMQPVPLPLRNKGKRKMVTWMWVVLTVIVVLLLFLAGNYISFSSFSFPQSAP